MNTTRSNKGLIVEYTKRDGTKQKALALYDDQKPEFSDYGKVFLRLLDDDLQEMTNGEGKKLIGLKHKNELTQIGFQD